MNNKLFTLLGLQQLSVIAAIVCSTSALFAQAPQVMITALSNNNYKIETTNLNADDLVFYRFSDGFEMTAMVNSFSPQAPVIRKFNTPNTQVSAFIARKNGPIDLTTRDVANSSCGSCVLPYAGLFTGEYVRIRDASWAPFVDPESPASLEDDKTNPTCNTPETPWFILPITLKSPQAYAYAEIDLPPGMTIAGAVVKNTWKELFVSQGMFSITDPHVQSFAYNTPGKLRINMSAAANLEFNVYLLIKNSTVLGEVSPFSAQVYNPSGTPIGPSSDSKLVTNLNPHDPNVLTPYESGVCVLQASTTPLHYQVDFQNLGQGRAESVHVKILVDPRVVDVSTVTADMFSSSHQLTSFEVQGNKVIIARFDGINLAGLDQDPQPSIASTKGWVVFSANRFPCIQPQATDDFQTQAFVTFIGAGGNFTETIPTNQANQAFRGSCLVDPECTDDRSESVSVPVANDDTFAPTCHPTLFSDRLILDVPASGSASTITVTIRDLNGKIWLNNRYNAAPDTPTNALFETAQLPAGMYLIQVRQGTDTKVFKAIKA